jgi:hypothetical protein
VYLNSSYYKVLLDYLTWAYGKEKIRGRKEICPTFSDCARVVKIIFRRNYPKLLSTGGGGREEWLRKIAIRFPYCIFPTKLTEFRTKLTEFVPFIFIISQYCPTVTRSEYCPIGFVCPTNWGGGCRAPRPVRPCYLRMHNALTPSLVFSGDVFTILRTIRQGITKIQTYIWTFLNRT